MKTIKKQLPTGITCIQHKKDNGVIAIEVEEQSYVTKTLTNLFKTFYN